MSKETLTGFIPYTLRKRFATTFVFGSCPGCERRGQGGEKKRTYDACCGDIEDDGLVLVVVSDVELLYEEGLWGFAVGDGRRDWERG